MCDTRIGTEQRLNVYRRRRRRRCVENGSWKDF